MSVEEEICDYFNSDSLPVIAMPTSKLSPVKGIKLIYPEGSKPIIPQEIIDKGMCILLVAVAEETFLKILRAEKCPNAPSSFYISACAPRTFFSALPLNHDSKKISSTANLRLK